MASSNDICISLSLQSRNQNTSHNVSQDTKPTRTSNGHPRPLPPVIIREPDVLVSVLQRLKASQGAICMFNVDRTFQIMLRSIDMDNDEEEGGDELLFFDVCLVKLEEDDSVVDDAQWDTILQLEHDGYVDDDDMVFVMDEWNLAARDPDRATLLHAVQRINELYRMTICPCNQYFIKDGGDMCPFCQLSCSGPDLKVAFCCVCQSETPRKHMVCQPCCSQRIHTKCLRAWHVRSGGSRCPMCRA